MVIGPGPLRLQLDTYSMTKSRVQPPRLAEKRPILTPKAKETAMPNPWRAAAMTAALFAVAAAFVERATDEFALGLLERHPGEVFGRGQREPAGDDVAGEIVFAKHQARRRATV